MPDTYVACSMSSLSREEYEGYRITLLAVCDAIDTTGRIAYRAPFENTGGFHGPAEALSHNLAALETASSLLYIHTREEASSALIELGYALKRRIPIIVLAKEGVPLPFYLRDADVAATFDMTIASFSNEEDLPIYVWQVLANEHQVH
ncbi:hypothetical protein FJY94_01730 [Candidatus Kaiserbacteria bacterium]|nr:hypothetical protein [Candidatus Kaiserbacteria bacterium]